MEEGVKIAKCKECGFRLDPKSLKEGKTICIACRKKMAAQKDRKPRIKHTKTIESVQRPEPQKTTSKKDFSKEEASLYLKKAALHTMKGEFKTAITVLNKSIKLDSSKAESFYLRGANYLKLQDYKKAIVDLTQAVALNPNYEKAYVQRAYIFDALEEYDKAIQDCNKVIELNPGEVNAYVLRANIHKKQGKYQLALEGFKQALTHSKDHDEWKTMRDDIHLMLGDVYYNLKNYKQTLKEFEEALKINPNNKQVKQAIIQIKDLIE